LDSCSKLRTGVEKDNVCVKLPKKQSDDSETARFREFPERALHLTTESATHRENSQTLDARFALGDFDETAIELPKTVTTDAPDAGRTESSIDETRGPS
jgi:hypothetical protein